MPQESNSEFLSAVIESYKETKKIKLTAKKMSMSPLKVRKLLITAEIYKTPLSEKIISLYQQGKSIAEIQEITGLGKSSINCYLPYTKSVYKQEKKSLNAERIRIYRQRCKSVKELKSAINDDNMKKGIDLLWQTLLLFQNYPFYTVKSLKFSYKIKGKELFFTRKSKSVTKATIDLSFEKVIQLKKKGIKITGPKKIGVFGASYIYPIFIRIGVI